MARLTLANDDALVYINGHLAVNDHDRTMRLQFIDVTAYLQAGWHLIAVKAHDSRGLYRACICLCEPEPKSW